MLFSELLTTFKTQNLAQKIYDIWVLVSIVLLAISFFAPTVADYSAWILIPAAIVGVWIRVVVYLKG